MAKLVVEDQDGRVRDERRFDGHVGPGCEADGVRKHEDIFQRRTRLLMQSKKNASTRESCTLGWRGARALMFNDRKERDWA